MEMIGFLDRGVALGPHADCLVMGSQRWTYGQVHQLTLRIASALHRCGAREGAKVAVLSPNDPRAFICVLGLLRAHMVWLPVNPRYVVGEIIDLLGRFSCEIAFLHSSFAPSLPLLRERLVGVRLIVGVDGSVGDAPAFEQWLADEPAVFDAPEPAPDDVAVIMATGGTTGRPKGVMQTHRGFETYIANHLATMAHAGRPRYLLVAPMTHAAGFMCFPMLVRGGVIVVIDNAQPRTIAEAIVAHGITDLFLPPTSIYMMLADDEVRAMRFPSLKYLLYGAAPMSAAKLREALRVFGPVLIQGFGQVEALMLCTVLQPEDHFVDGDIASEVRLTSCGRPAPFVSVAVMAEDGKFLGDGEIGEIVVRAGNVMKGYYEDESATAETRRYGWHHTGDLGYRDVEGYYHLVDRARDLIISGGYNIYPSQIEQVIWTHASVQDCAVVGLPHDKWGEAVTAVVELKAGFNATEAEIIAMCKSRLGSIKAPKTVLFWDRLPRTPVGKISKRDIKNHFWQAQQRRI